MEINVSCDIRQRAIFSRQQKDFEVLSKAHKGIKDTNERRQINSMILWKKNVRWRNYRNIFLTTLYDRPARKQLC